MASAGLALAGHKVIGVDVDIGRIRSLSMGVSPSYEPGLEVWLNQGIRKGNLRFIHRDDMFKEPGDVVLISTGTPPTTDDSPDLRQIWSSLDWLKKFKLNGVVVAMKSTVPPGTGQAILRDLLVGTGAKYVSNPEFLREGQALADWQSPDRIVLGVEPTDHRSISTMKRMYEGIDSPILVTDVTSAEMIKYASNALLATRISFINEMAAVCDHVGASIDHVSDGLAMDSRTGNKLYAGVGYGGSCFPKDVCALDRVALLNGLELNLLKSVIRVNKRQRQLPLQALIERFGDDLSSLNIGVLGLSFKPGTDDIREAASIDLIQHLVERNATVRAYDPRANRAACTALPSTVNFARSPLEACKGTHAVMIMTEWPEIVSADWHEIFASMLKPKYMFDGRNCLNAREMASLGFEYNGVGRGSPASHTRIGANGKTANQMQPAWVPL